VFLFLSQAFEAGHFIQIDEEKPMAGRMLENGSRNDQAEDWPQQNGYRRVTNNAHKLLARDARPTLVASSAPSVRR